MRALAFSVHLLTACGAALALLAMMAAVRGAWPAMFLWLGLALLIDGLDGMLARMLRIAERLPRWSGETIDLVVDFTAYVFVPAYAIAASGVLPAEVSVAAGAAISISGALYFADRQMKTAEHHFRGFPALWNLVAFYLLLLRPAPWLAVAAVVLFVILTFVPLRFVHPIRVRAWRPVTVALLTLWSALAFAAVLRDLTPNLWMTATLCAIAVYFLVVGLLPARGNPT